MRIYWGHTIAQVLFFKRIYWGYRNKIDLGGTGGVYPPTSLWHGVIGT